MYKGLIEAILRGEIDQATSRKIIVLPSSFTGGATYIFQNYQDAIATCRWAGYSELFITFTCNQKWPELCRVLEKKTHKRVKIPYLVCKLFKIKIKPFNQGHKEGTNIWKSKVSYVDNLIADQSIFLE